MNKSRPPPVIYIQLHPYRPPAPDPSPRSSVKATRVAEAIRQNLSAQLDRLEKRVSQCSRREAIALGAVATSVVVRLALGEQIVNAGGFAFFQTWPTVCAGVSAILSFIAWVIKMCLLVAASVVGLFILCGIGGFLLDVVLTPPSSTDSESPEKNECDEKPQTKELSSATPSRKVLGDFIDAEGLIRQITNERRLKDVTRARAEFVAHDRDRNWTIRGRIDVEHRSFHFYDDDWENV